MGSTDKSLTGWIKLHRSMLESTVFANERKLKVFIWCLLRANPQPCEVRIGKTTIALERGQFLTSSLKAAEELGLGRHSIRGQLDGLQRDGAVAISSASKYSVITVVNYDVYQKGAGKRGQVCGHQNGQQKLLAAATKTATEEEYIKKREEEERISAEKTENENGWDDEGWGFE